MKGAVSQPVFLEAERNIASKLGSEALGRYHRLVVLTPITIVPLPPETSRHQYRVIAGEKDEHVIAAAVAAEAAFLLTLDKPLEDRVNEGDLSIKALSPGTFIKTVLVHHIDYPKTRKAVHGRCHPTGLYSGRML